MSLCAESPSIKLCSRLSRWRAGRLLRFCWALIGGRDMHQAGFDVEQRLANEVRLLWPISALIEQLAPLSGQTDRIGEWLKPFTIEFLKKLQIHLGQQANEDARVQFLWLGMASKNGSESLLARIAALFSKSLEPPVKRKPAYYYKPKRPTWQISEQQKQRSRDLARGRRLVMANFAEAFLASTVAQGPKEATELKAAAVDEPDNGELAEAPIAEPGRGPPQASAA